MHDELFENLFNQNKIHREAGYLEGLSDAYREMARKLGSDLTPLEKELEHYVNQFLPPF